jgi:hypothetical protein
LQHLPLDCFVASAPRNDGIGIFPFLQTRGIRAIRQRGQNFGMKDRGRRVTDPVLLKPVTRRPMCGDF